MIGLVDCNNFFVSCERVFRPDLQHRPVAVLSNIDGCVIARSNEVKAMGIPMGAPYFKIKDILETNNTVIFSSNFSLYGDLSARVMSIVESLAPRVEVYSIDEVFVDFSGIRDPHALATLIRETILKQVGIPTCVGVSHTKTLAKVANHIAKKNSSFQGVCILSEEHEIDAALATLEAGDVWGIGRKSAEKLAGAHIHTALSLKKADPTWMRKYFTVMGERIVRELNGISCLKIDDIVIPRQSMQVTRSFAHGITGHEPLREKVVAFATRISEKMRQHGLSTRSVEVSIRTNYHKEGSPQYRNSAMRPLPFLSNDTFTLVEACTKIFESLYRPGFSYHKAGVMVHDLVPEKPQGAIQLNLFEEEKLTSPKIQELVKAMDSLNKKFGRGTLQVASCGIQRGRGEKKVTHNKSGNLQGHQLRKSPSYTTKWTELPLVK